LVRRRNSKKKKQEGTKKAKQMLTRQPQVIGQVWPGVEVTNNNRALPLPPRTCFCLIPVGLDMELFKLFTQAGKLKWTAAVRGQKTENREQWSSRVAEQSLL